MKIVHSIDYNKLVSLENILHCWDEFKKDKVAKRDVVRFERHLEDNIFSLHRVLREQTYRHSPYSTFHIYDPKHRIISKAAAKDRLVHHIVFEKLYQIFDPTFIYHSYSSRIGKGTHLAVQNLARSLGKESRNYTRSAFVLKCDIKKFFQSVSHQKLLQMIQNKIKDKDFLLLVEEIVRSFPSPVDKIALGGGVTLYEKRGLPIGNLTSQIFANIYLNELDQFMKHKLGVKQYFRYADDFIVVSDSPDYLSDVKNRVEDFLGITLDLSLHPDKVEIRKFAQGVDFLGYVILPHHIVVRTKTRKRMFKKMFQKQELVSLGELESESFYQTTQSYLGMLKHCDAYDISNIVRNNFLS